MKYDSIIQNFISYANKTDNIRAAMIIGSRARTDEPADDYSDLDVVVFALDTEKQIHDTEWLFEIGEYHITFVETLPVGDGKERRVMFTDALDVDFAILPAEHSKDIVKDQEIQTTLVNGMKILLDKDNILSDLDIAPLNKKNTSIEIPSEEVFDNIVNDFWYHCIWSIKKIRRGEIWTAKMCVDVYQKQLLLKMIEIYTAHHNPETKIWHNGRFLERWTKAEIVKLLENCFAHYDKKDIIHALKATMNLFSVVSRKNAETLGFNYPQAAEDYVWGWMKD